MLASSIGPLITNLAHPYYTHNTHSVEIKSNSSINFRIIPAVGGYILEMTSLEGSDYMHGICNVKRYILKEKNMGKQIEKILAIEILRK